MVTLAFLYLLFGTTVLDGMFHGWWLAAVIVLLIAQFVAFIVKVTSE